MKIGGFQPLSLSDYPSTPAAVIFLQGCNLRCPYCHNSSLIPATADTYESLESIHTYLNKRKNTLSAVVITGGEPTLQEDLIPFLTTIKELGYSIKLDTNGTRPKMLQSVITANLISYIAMDIKAPWSKYDKLSGTTVNLDTIKESVNIITHSNIPHHFRTTYYQVMLNDDDLHSIKDTLPPDTPYLVQQCKTAPT